VRMSDRWLMSGVVIAIVTLIGCGKPDPRKRPGFIDTTDPKEGLKQLNASAKQGDKKQVPSPKPGGS